MNKEAIVDTLATAARTVAVTVLVTVVARALGQMDTGNKKIVLFTAQK